MESAIFSQVMAGPSGAYFNFFDSGLGGFQSLTHMGLLSWFARRSGDGFDRTACITLLDSEIKTMKQVRSTRFYPLHLLNMALLGDDTPGTFTWPETWFGGGEEPIVVLRDRQNTPDAFFLAAKGGRAADNHGNMDAGSFVFELNGVRWSIDPGNQDYNTLEQIMGGGLWSSDQDAPRWSLLTKNSGGHSCLVINDEMHLADARAPLVKWDLREDLPSFTFDLSALYGDHLNEARRTFSRPESGILRISDALVFSPETRSITWQLITCADPEETEDGVLLRQDGATLFLRLPRGYPCEVKVVSLSPPPLAYDKDIAGLKRLELHWDRTAFKGDEVILQVEMSGELAE